MKVEKLTGIFTGSFIGDGSQLSGVVSYTDTDTSNYIKSIGVISGSTQVSFTGLRNRPTLVSGSSQISFAGITNKPSLISGSGVNRYIPVYQGSSFTATSSLFQTGSNIRIQSTGYLQIPVGTTGQRIFSPTGSIRYNTTLGVAEIYSGTSWVSFAEGSYTVEYLVVAGGGSGGQGGGGGGGAGGFLSGSVVVQKNRTYPITIGAGAAATPNSAGPGDVNGLSGNNSSFSDLIVCIGGGGGGAYVTNTSGLSGGSGGGGGATVGATGGTGNTGQGKRGGNTEVANVGAGGGGGAMVNGGAGQPTAGTGGAGATTRFTGPITSYAGGGGGGEYGGTAAAGGVGGGGTGNSNSNGTAGTVNTGGGGGGGSFNTTFFGGGAGGSGIVILKYYGGPKGIGGIATTWSGSTIHTFTGAGSFTA